MKRVLILGLIVGVLVACFSEPTLADGKVKRMEESMDAGTLPLRLNLSTVREALTRSRIALSAFSRDR